MLVSEFLWHARLANHKKWFARQSAWTGHQKGNCVHFQCWLENKKKLSNLMSSMGVNIPQAINGTSFLLWDILLSTPEDCVTLIKKGINKIYQGQYKTRVSIFNSLNLCWVLIGFSILCSFRVLRVEDIFSMQHREIVTVRPDQMCSKWWLNLMIN